MATVSAAGNKNNKIESFIYGACFICVATAGDTRRGLLPMPMAMLIPFAWPLLL